MILLYFPAIEKIKETEVMKNILIIEDDAKMRKMYSQMLASEGYRVIEAANAMCANEALKADNINLILLDIKMPEVDGSVFYEITKLFHRQVKVIVSSVYSIDEQMRLVAEAADYHDKSQGVNILLTKIKRVLKDA